ncbi:MAG: NAD(P)-dependent oxidoreductase [Anaerolineales bacterium]|jgi:D-3-phosphoglycerate dehydrogenase
MKALFIEDGSSFEELLSTSENLDRLPVLKNMDLVFAKDTNMQKWKTPAEYIQKIETQGPEGWIIPDKAVMEEIKTAEILFVHASGVTRALLEEGNKLKAIFCLRSGVEGINLIAASELGITVSNCPSRLAEPVSDMAIAFMLSECRGILRGNLIATDGDWQQRDVYEDRINSPLCNLIIGIVGYGGIGKILARKLVKGFGSTVLAYDPFSSKEIMEKDGVIWSKTMAELLKKSDIVSMQARLTDNTRNMFGENEFNQMKPTSIFINTARAGLVDEGALVKALQNKVIRGAGLDVYSQEPLPKDHPFLNMNNVTLMPHRAGATSTIVMNSLRLLMPEVERFVKGEKLHFQVNDT